MRREFGGADVDTDTGGGVSVEYTIICDGCSAHIDASLRSAAAARKSVREMGGRVNLPGAKDLCPACVREGRRPE